MYYYVAAHDVANLTTFRGAGNVTWIENRARNNPLSFAVIDLAPPDIGVIGGLVDPVPDQAAQNLSFTVTEVGPGAVAWARIYYRSEGQAWDSGRYVTWTDGWTNISSTVYVYNEKIFYYAAAQDTNSNTNYRGTSGITTSEAAAQADAFNFSINDVTPPEIGPITEGWDPVADAVNQTLACVITDLPNGLDWACAYYRNGSEAWDAGRYINFTAGTATFWYDSYKNSSTVYYYLAARDKAGHLTFRGATGMVATEGDAQADPCLFGVTHPPPPALPTGTITLYYPGQDLPYGGTIVDVTSQVITDTYSQTVGDGTKFTISTTCGTILAADVDPALAGVQLYSSDGRVSFQVQLPAGSGACVLSITSVQGDAAGTFNLEYVEAPAFPFEIVIYAGIAGGAVVAVLVIARRVRRRRFLI